MNDFLGNLIANVLQPAEALQPRLGPFYGSSPTAFFASRNEAAFETEESIAAPPLLDTPSVVPFSKQTITVPINEVKANSNTPTPSTNLSQPGSSLEPPPFVAPPFPRRANMPVADSSLDLPKEMEMETPRNAVPITLAEFPALERARPGSEIDFSTKSEKMVSATAHREPVQPMSPPFPHAEPASLFKAGRTVQKFPEMDVFTYAKRHHAFSSITPVLQPAPESLMEFATKSPPADSERTPIIRVNIGRIEVRAVAPPAPAPARPRRSRSGPLMSLEDYLKQRSGRQR